MDKDNPITVSLLIIRWGYDQTEIQASKQQQGGHTPAPGNGFTGPAIKVGRRTQSMKEFPHMPVINSPFGFQEILASVGCQPGLQHSMQGQVFCQYSMCQSAEVVPSLYYTGSENYRSGNILE